VTATAIKRAETGEGIIVRLQEHAGRETDYTLESAALGLNHRGRIKPWEIRTLMITAEKGSRAAGVKEVNLLER
jgi:hypothetical protein